MGSTKRLKVLISAYACEPGKGSEPGVGWGFATALARYHDVWVLTRSNNRAAIEAELCRRPVPGLQFEYFDLPSWAKWWKRSGWGTRLYYQLWQLAIPKRISVLKRRENFDIVHHLTFVKYWAPAGAAFAAAPFIWGPVGGGETAPRTLWRDLGFQGRVQEEMRNVARKLGEADPLVRIAARRSSIAFATTEQTAERLYALGARNVRVMSQVAVDNDFYLSRRTDSKQVDRQLTFASVGQLLPLKGFHLGLRAFAMAALPNAEYIIVGDGQDRLRLEQLASELGIKHKVHFLGQQSREKALSIIAGCAALVHPSLHDSGGFVCLEAMALGKPVVCLDLGGPAIIVDSHSGIRIAPSTIHEVVHELSKAMTRLASDEELRTSMGEAAQRRAFAEFTWERKAQILSQYYSEVHIAAKAGARAYRSVPRNR